MATAPPRFLLQQYFSYFGPVVVFLMGLSIFYVTLVTVRLPSLPASFPIPVHEL